MLVAETVAPHSHTLLFLLAVLAIVPLAALLSHATEAVAAKTGDAVGGLLNATLGNLTELIIAITALRAGQYMLVKASIAGAIVTNALFMLGACLLLGGLRYHVQEYYQPCRRPLLEFYDAPSKLDSRVAISRQARGVASKMRPRLLLPGLCTGAAPAVFRHESSLHSILAIPRGPRGWSVPARVHPQLTARRGAASPHVCAFGPAGLTGE